MIENSFDKYIMYRKFIKMGQIRQNYEDSVLNQEPCPINGKLLALT